MGTRSAADGPGQQGQGAGGAASAAQRCAEVLAEAATRSGSSAARQGIMWGGSCGGAAGSSATGIGGGRSTPGTRYVPASIVVGCGRGEGTGISATICRVPPCCRALLPSMLRQHLPAVLPFELVAAWLFPFAFSNPVPPACRACLAARPPGFVAVLATANALEDVPLPLGRCFTHTLAVAAPSSEERRLLLRHLLRSAAAAADAASAAGMLPGCEMGLGDGALGDTAERELDAAADSLTAQTAGLLPRDLCGLAADAAAAALGRAAVAAFPPGVLPACLRGKTVTGRALAAAGANTRSVVGSSTAAAPAHASTGGAVAALDLDRDVRAALDRVKSRTAVEVRAGWLCAANCKLALHIRAAHRHSKGSPKSDSHRRR